VGIAIGAFASWAGVPGAGEAALITGAVFAARGRLDIATVLLAAFVGANIGGLVGWGAGLRVGETVAGAPGPLYRWRRRALRSGERFYERWGVLAVYFTPSWIAGVHKLRPAKFIPANAISALIWTLLIGLGTYLIGPSVAEIASDVGLVGLILIGCAVVGVVVANTIRRRRKRRNRAA
jgi:membrane protein DedA with SNARE-associated domain